MRLPSTGASTGFILLEDVLLLKLDRLFPATPLPGQLRLPGCCATATSEVEDEAEDLKCANSRWR